MKKLLVLPFIILFACDSNEQTESEPEVIAEAAIYSLEQIDDTSFEVKETQVGTATFSQAGNVVTLDISLSGMTPNTQKAVHIHNGTVEVPGRHWNRGSYIAACNQRSLGAVWAKPFAGDVGNVSIDSEGNGHFSLQTDLWAFNSGDENDLLDKVIIVHEGPQDFIVECDPAHDHNHLHSNPKIGGGTITLVSDVTKVEQVAIDMPNPPSFTICK